jgi:hypothetical protein
VCLKHSVVLTYPSSVALHPIFWPWPSRSASFILFSMLEQICGIPLNSFLPQIKYIILSKFYTALFWCLLQNVLNTVKVKGKSIPLQALRVPGGWSSQISRQSAYEGVTVVSPMHWLLLPPGNIPGTHFCYRLSQPQGQKDYVNEKFQWHHQEF